MKKNLLAVVSSLLIFATVSLRYFIGWTSVQTGDRLLLPVRVEKIETNAFPRMAYLRYYNFIPVEELKREKGTIVVKRSEDGRIDFVANAEGQKRHSRELILKYEIVSPVSFASEQKEPNVRFAASLLRYRDQFSPSAVRYAVVYVNAAGKAFLTGLADATGTMLVRGIGLERFRIL